MKKVLRWEVVAALVFLMAAMLVLAGCGSDVTGLHTLTNSDETQANGDADNDDSNSDGTNYNRILNIDYEDDSLDPTQGGIRADGNITVVNTHSRTGNYAVRSEVTDQDEPIHGGIRSESSPIDVEATRYYNQSTFYYGFSIYIVENWENDGLYEDILFQWKHTQAAPDAFLCIKREEFYLRNNWHENDEVIRHQYDLPVISPGWHDFVFYFTWSQDDDGVITVWHKTEAETDYNLVLEATGPNKFDDDKIGAFGYIKWGLYTPKWNNNTTTTVRNRVVYHDNIRIGTTFSDVDPGL